MNTPIPPAPQVVYVQAQSTGRGLGIAALVLGIVGTLFGLIPLTGFIAIICGVLALILGLLGVRRAKASGTGKGPPRAGWLLGIAALVLGVIGLVIVTQAVNDLDDCFDGNQAACDSLDS